MNIMLGCDPETFLMNQMGELKSSVGLIGGSKEHPMPLALGEGYAVQEDNVAMEFNVPPASDVRSFVRSINATLDHLTEMVSHAHGLSISQLSAASFPEAELQSFAAKQFGCDPDYNAYTKKRNPAPRAQDKNLRSCGGHVHIGFDKTKADVINVIKLMDLHLGVPSVLMDKGDLRKNLYGKAGAFRDKSYGVEYRTLSNFWIFKPELITWVWNNTERAVQAAVEQFTISDDDEAAIVQAINNNDKLVAEMLIEKFNLETVYA